MRGSGRGVGAASAGGAVRRGWTAQGRTELGRRRIGVEQRAAELQVHCERHEVLLHDLVQVALDPAVVRVGSHDEPLAGRAELGDLGA